MISKSQCSGCHSALTEKISELAYFRELTFCIQGIYAQRSVRCLRAALLNALSELNMKVCGAKPNIRAACSIADKVIYLCQ